jgi:hypothetical protein
MDAELIKSLLTGAGPIGLLAYGVFIHYSKVTQANQDRLVELIGQWKGQSDLLVRVVQENSAAISALVTRLDQDRD